MKKKAHELIFISQIKRDGSGVEEISEDYLNAISNNDIMKEEYYHLQCLSLTEKTYIAFNFNAYVVRLK